VGNALRFVRSGTRHLPGGSISVRVLRAEDTAIVEVEDDGAGIAPERLPGLFERRGDGAPPLGFALKMARDVALAHGGALDVESTTDPERHGTIVRLSLPALGNS